MVQSETILNYQRTGTKGCELPQELLDDAAHTEVATQKMREAQLHEVCSGAYWGFLRRSGYKPFFARDVNLLIFCKLKQVGPVSKKDNDVSFLP